MRFDTIVAPITGLPPAGVAWLRLSGPESWEIAAKLLSPWPEEVRPRFALFGHFPWGDEGLAIPFAEGQSYTGEQTVELSMHGAQASIRAALETCIAAGARTADPGEFTQRAFLNGRLDLSQAEAVRETIEAVTDVQLRQANRNRKGALRDAIAEVRQSLIRELAAVEASVDFSEEVGEVDRVAMSARLDETIDRLQSLAEGARVSRIVRDGYRIAIVGPPNAGKSSLLNRLLGSERAIVTDIPGTTRDFVEERADFGGVPVVLVDTAGLRETGDVVERIGVERARERAREADAIWFVYDGAVGLTDDDLQEVAALGAPVTFLANKCDASKRDTDLREAGHSISARTGEGIEALIREVQEAVLRSAPAISVNERQTSHLLDAIASLNELRRSLDFDGPDDLISVFLQDSLASLGQITGETGDTGLLESIFRDFCVGK